MARRTRADAALLLVGLLVVSGATPLVQTPGRAAGSADGQGASATGIDSCTTITSPGEYVLTADIESDVYTCLSVEASDVTVDGDGHTITVNATFRESGRFLPSRSPFHFGAGVTVGSPDASVTNVSVENLTVTGLDAGVQFVNVHRGRVRGVTATDNEVGVRLSDTTAVTITDTTATEHVGDAIRVSAAAGVQITDTRASDNRFAGIVLADTTDSVVFNATTARNFGDGIVVRNATRVTLQRVTVAQNTVGVTLWDTRRTTVTESRIDRNAFAGLALVDADTNTVSETVVSNTTAATRLLAEPSGVWLYNATRNRFESVHLLDNREWAVYARNRSGANAFVDLRIEGRLSPSLTTANQTRLGDISPGGRRAGDHHERWSRRHGRARGL